LIVNKRVLSFDPCAVQCGHKSQVVGQALSPADIQTNSSSFHMDMQENILHGGGDMRFDRPVQQQQQPPMGDGLLAEDGGCAADNLRSVGGQDGGCGEGARMRSLSLDPRHQQDQGDAGLSMGGEPLWHNGAGAADEEERARSWRRDSYHVPRLQQAQGPSSWHGDNMRPLPQSWEGPVAAAAGLGAGQVWRRDACGGGGGSGRFVVEHHNGFRSGEAAAAGWQQASLKEPEGGQEVVDQGWRLPNIPRRGQDAGWRHTDFIVSGTFSVFLTGLSISARSSFYCCGHLRPDLGSVFVMSYEKYRLGSQFKYSHMFLFTGVNRTV
jgi:hypothetical protein